MRTGPAVTDHAGDPSGAAVDRNDVAYLIDVANQYFHTPIVPGDIV